MATAPKIDDGIQSGTDIVAAVAAKHAIVLLDTEKFDVFYEALKAKAPTDADVATKKGRDALRSFAADVRSEKASINKDRLRLTKEWRDLTAQVNAAGKEIDERLESLAAETRAPLTEWEEAEKARAAECEATINRIVLAGTITVEDTAEAVRQRGAEVWNTEIDPDKFGDLFERAFKAKEHVVGLLKTALIRLTKEEADRAELEKLRAEAAERERLEAERREAEDRERRAQEEARAAEVRRLAAEQAEKDRIATAEKAAEERARRAAEQAAQDERERIQREHDAALALERKAREDAERTAQAERDRLKREAEASEAEARRIAAEQERRERNRQHVGKIMGEAKAAIMSCGASEEVAKAIVIAIKANTIPHVGITF